MFSTKRVAQPRFASSAPDSDVIWTAPTQSICRFIRWLRVNGTAVPSFPSRHKVQKDRPWQLTAPSASRKKIRQIAIALLVADERNGPENYPGATNCQFSGCYAGVHRSKWAAELAIRRRWRAAGHSAPGDGPIALSPVPALRQGMCRADRSYKRPNRETSLALDLDDVLTLLNYLASSPRPHLARFTDLASKLARFQRRDSENESGQGNFRILDLPGSKENVPERSRKLRKSKPDKWLALQYQRRASVPCWLPGSNRSCSPHHVVLRGRNAFRSLGQELAGSWLPQCGRSRYLARRMGQGRQPARERVATAAGSKWRYRQTLCIQQCVWAF